MIRVFSSDSTEFTSNGLGALTDAISCIVKEERNGSFELTMKYPMTGMHFDELVLRNIIVAKSNPRGTPQAFRIYKITRPIKGVVTVNAEHISYDMTGLIVKPFTAVGIQDTLIKLKQNCVSTCPFTFWTDKDVGSDFETAIPMSMRSLLGGTSGSILDVYGKGEYKFDNYDVKLYLNRGANNNVTIRYGKNLTDLEQEENCSEVYTGIYPYWYKEDEGLVEIGENDKIVPAPGTYDFTRILPVDFTDDFEAKPDPADLQFHAEDYVEYYDIGVPKVSLDVSFIQLAKSQEYHDYALLEEINLCDTINVEFPKMHVSATAKVIATEYNALTDEYESLSIGEPKDDLASTIASVNQEIVEVVDKSQSRMEAAANHATQTLAGAFGGNFVINSQDGHPYEILFMDNPDKTLAVNVLRINQNGIGFSTSGYNGPYTTAWTIDGNFVADFITTGVMDANLIKANIFQDRTGSFSLNMETGKLHSTVIGELTQTVDDNLIEAKEFASSQLVQANNYVDIKIQEQKTTYIDPLTPTVENISALMRFDTDGLKISGTRNAPDGSYVQIAADHQTFFTDGEEALNLSSEGVTTKAVYSEEAVSAKSVSIRPWIWFVNGNVLELGKES